MKIFKTRLTPIISHYSIVTVVVIRLLLENKLEFGGKRMEYELVGADVL